MTSTDFSIYFLKRFPTFYVFLFGFVVFVFETQPVLVAEPYIVVSPSERENLVRLCLLPRALVGDTLRKKSILGNAAKMALQTEASYFGGYFKCPQKRIPHPLLSMIG